MTKINSIVLLILILLSTQNIKAQLNPINDSSWVLQSGVSDEFNSSFNYSKWYTFDSVPDHGLEMMFDRPLHKNVFTSGGSLKIKVAALSPETYYWNAAIGAMDTFHYQSGTVYAVSTFKYGYLEINARFPTGNTAFWPAYFLFNADCDSTHGPLWYQEIDIAENGSLNSLDGDKMDENFHWGGTNSCNYLDNGINYHNIGLPRIDSLHKYALQWDSDSVTFYFDDVPIRTIPDDSVPTPNHAMKLVFDIYVDKAYAPHPAFSPTYFSIDYFHYYKLNMHCGYTKTISKPGRDYYWDTPARAVKQSIITTTVGADSPTFNLSDLCTLRATQSVTLDAGTTINGTGSGQFSAIVMPCITY